MDRMSQLSIKRRGSLSIDKSEVKISDWDQKAIICKNGAWIFSGSASVQIIYPKTMMIKHEEHGENEMIKLRKIPENETKELILSSIIKKFGAQTSDIIYDLELPQLMFLLMAQESP